ncbi:hypothetical protein ACEQ8H_003147 [Pleosporales sp. CAS-2024a]
MAASPRPNASIADKIHCIYDGLRDPTKPSSPENDTQTLENKVEKVKVQDKETSLEDSIIRSFLYTGITDKVAKESSDSTASTHKLHDSEDANAATSGRQAHANAHKANPGPVHADNLPAPASKEELKKRAEELNQ